MREIPVDGDASINRSLIRYLLLHRKCQSRNFRLVSDDSRRQEKQQSGKEGKIANVQSRKKLEKQEKFKDKTAETIRRQPKKMKVGKLRV